MLSQPIDLAIAIASLISVLTLPFPVSRIFHAYVWQNNLVSALAFIKLDAVLLCFSCLSLTWINLGLPFIPFCFYQFQLHLGLFVCAYHYSVSEHRHPFTWMRRAMKSDCTWDVLESGNCGTGLNRWQTANHRGMMKAMTIFINLRFCYLYA